MRYALLTVIVLFTGILALRHEAQPQPAQLDIVGVNDLLCIGIWDIHPTGGETLKTVRVDAQGNASLFYIGQVKLGGMNFSQAEDVISAAYRNAGVLNNAFPSLNRLEQGNAASMQSGSIAPGDRICVHMLDLVPEVRHSRILIVSPGGNVGLPMMGQFHVGGMTEAAAEAAIQRGMADKFGVNNLAVSVLRLSPKQLDEPTVATPSGTQATSDGSRPRK